MEGQRHRRSKTYLGATQEAYWHVKSALSELQAAQDLLPGADNNWRSFPEYTGGPLLSRRTEDGRIDSRIVRPGFT
jgi:hypothetical protein